MLIRDLPNRETGLCVAWSGSTWREFPQPQVATKAPTVVTLPVRLGAKNAHNDRGIMREVYRCLEVPLNTAQVQARTSLRDGQVRNALAQLIAFGMVEPQGRLCGGKVYQRTRA